MIPLSDENPPRSTPFVTYILIALNVAVFVYQLSLGDRVEGFIQSCAFVPAELATGRDIAPPNCVQPFWLTIFTAMFMHAGLLHIGSNMLYLWIFGNNVEDRLGRVVFLGFYLVGGVAAALTQIAIDPESTAPLVGASGAIAAALGAYLVLYPGARILSLVFLGFFYQLIEIPALVVLGFWFILQLIDGLGSLGASNAQGGVAFFAHIGGFVVGVIVGLLIRGRGSGPRLAYVG
jgi:membrane associated rhomboid family serine protease